MTTASNMKYADIWLVRSSPSIGREFYGMRPAVIIQKQFLPRGMGLVTVMLMSSYKGKKWKHDILVRPDHANRLHGDTLVKVQHIKSFDTERLVHRIGTLDSETMKRIQQYLFRHFSLS